MLLDRVFEMAPVGLSLVDESGALIKVNPAFAQLFGYQPEELTGRSHRILLSPWEQPWTGRLRANGAYEWSGVTKDGRTVWIRSTASSLADVVGRRLSLSASFEVIDHRQAEERFRLVVEAAPNGMVMVDHTGRIVLVNSQIERLFGYRREELIGEPIERLVPMRFRDQHPDDRSKFMEKPAARPMGAGRDLFGQRKDGSEVPVEIGLNPIRTGQGLFVLASVVDITERKQAEAKITSSLREKEVLLKEIHHRVKNNLQIICSLLNLQSAQVRTPEVVKLFAESERRVRSMALLHEHLYGAEDLSSIAMDGYLKSLIGHLQQSAAVGRHVRVESTTDGLSLGIDEAIPCGLIVSELASNALKHAFPGGRPGTVVIRLAREDGEVRLEVRDDGVGLPDAARFEQASTLGLRLVSALTDQLFGRIELHRQPGTAVIVRFPSQH